MATLIIDAVNSLPEAKLREEYWAQDGYSPIEPGIMCVAQAIWSNYTQSSVEGSIAFGAEEDIYVVIMKKA